MTRPVPETLLTGWPRTVVRTWSMVEKKPRPGRSGYAGGTRPGRSGCAGGGLRLTVRGNAKPLLTVRPGEVLALGEVRVGEAVRRDLVIEVGPTEVVLGPPEKMAGLSVEMGDGRLAAGGKTPLAVVFRGEKVGRFRCVLSLPVVSPPEQPPVGIVVHGTAVAAE